ncbi:precorrin-6A/cobalt-precorrin-6A reductase [Propionispira arboris]|uniref:Precorrin-6A/cobalt-precorrin-6A reductase n=1 Tax=Propionispira arboris TaxID=84035 RepID=A0A1H6W6E5_9FIRM|nr:cobalt-precorrin-6A reductase [Propionispira arboris]SEJ10784.1 precorrin-6A/cobalt-precorrin-6A reductase [Propionispira arboris]
MIFVLAGTQDGRELVQELLKAKYPVIASVVSEYGKHLLADKQLQINDKPLDLAELEQFIIDKKINLLVDASHPYAVNVTKNAILVCQKMNIPYIRYERPAVAMPVYDKLYLVDDYQAAAKQSALLGETIFLTTGSRNLKTFKQSSYLEKHHLIARVLPDAKVLTECLKLGFFAKDIIAMQGPFSHELNIELYKKYRAEVIVTKNSGEIGGTDTKITAAIEMELPIVMIDRPTIDYAASAATYDEVLALIKKMI